uniref:Uncharacterized protein n=1 Tax=Rhabditophanes sp. KR3021 TaxID=114890 RepID=A0AC35U0V6_9BILA
MCTDIPQNQTSIEATTPSNKSSRWRNLLNSLKLIKFTNNSYYQLPCLKIDATSAGKGCCYLFQGGIIAFSLIIITGNLIFSNDTASFEPFTKTFTTYDELAEYWLSPYWTVRACVSAIGGTSYFIALKYQSTNLTGVMISISFAELYIVSFCSFVVFMDVMVVLWLNPQYFIDPFGMDGRGLFNQDFVV